MKYFYQLAILTLCSYFYINNLFSQITLPPEDIIWSVDFSEGEFPQGWATDDASGQSALWTWCSDPEIDNVGGCPKIWDGDNNQLPFNAPSASNGFMTMDSDGYMMLKTSHVSQVTSPVINLSNEDRVWISFYSHLGAFNINPDQNAVLKVSNDGGENFTTYNCFPNFPDIEIKENRWSENPQFISFNISEIAALQEEVILQWQWTGNFEYVWNLDDIILSKVDPRFDNNLSIIQHALPSNLSTPISQLRPIPYAMEVINNGRSIQSNVKMTITIFDLDEFEEVYHDTILMASLPADSTTQLVLFDGQGFVPDNSSMNFLGTYEVISDSIDNLPDDNLYEFFFQISESTFAKENVISPSKSTSPDETEWDEGEPLSWAWGNHFYFPKGNGYYATNATFSVANTIELNGVSVKVVLYKWIDNDQDAIVAPDERIRVGLAEYEFNGQEPINTPITLPLFVENTMEPPMLDDQQHYVLMLEYDAPDDQTKVFINRNNQPIEYGPSLEVESQIGIPQYAGLLGINHPLSQTAYEPFGFNTFWAPILRLHISNTVSNSNVLSTESFLNLFPNPAQDKLNIFMDFGQRTESANLYIMDGSGRLIIQKNYNNIEQTIEHVDLNELNQGVYFVELSSSIGRTMKRFVKLK